MMTMTTIGEFQVRGVRVGNLFVHKEYFRTDRLPGRFKFGKQYRISHVVSGYWLGDSYLYKTQAQAVRMAKRLDRAIPEFQNDAEFLKFHRKRIIAKIEQALRRLR